MWGWSQLTQFTKEVLEEKEPAEDGEETHESNSSTSQEKVEDENSKLTSLFQKQQNELIRLRNERDEIKSDLEATRLSINHQYSTLLKKKEEETEVLKVQLDKEIRKSEELRRRKVNYDDGEMEKLKRECESLREKNTTLLEKIQLDNDTILKLKTESDLLREKNSELVKNLSELKSQKEREVTKVKEVEKLPQPPSHYESELIQLRTELSQSRGINKTTTEEISRKNEELESFREDFSRMKEELARARNDLTRLRDHMRTAEHDSEETIIDLKTKLETTTLLLEEKETLLRNMEEHSPALYESLKKDLAKTKEELEEKRREQDSLQSVIEQLHYVQEQEIQLRTLHMSNEIKSQAEKISEMEKKMKNFQEISTENGILKKDLENLRELFESRGRELERLHLELQPLQATLDQTLKKLNYELKNNQDVIDKQIVTKLIVTYFSSPTQKQEVLEVMAGILNFSEQNRAQIGLQTPNTPKKGWLGGWFSSGKIRNPAGENPITSADPAEGKNFTDLWIAFLLKEAENEKNSTPFVVNEKKPEKNSENSEKSSENLKNSEKMESNSK